MNKTVIILLLIFTFTFSFYLSGMFCETKNVMPEDKPIPADINAIPIVQVTARAFCEYGIDSNGNDYGPGYVIISTESSIPLYSNLDIDIYGSCQVVAVSPYLAKDEVLVWKQSPSEVKAFDQQTAWVRVLGEGERYDGR